MNKTIILREKADDYFLKYINENNMFNIYKNGAYNNIFFRFIRKFNLSLFPLFFNTKWKQRLKNCKRIIIFDNGYTDHISKYIKKKNSNIKIIMWFWNSINQVNEKIINDKNIDEFWTFDINNANEYYFKYNTQFYSLNVKLKNNKIEYDSFFIGRDKGRKAKLKEIQNIFNNFGLNLKSYVINDENEVKTYDEYLDLLSKSKTILDIVSNYQSGLTLRCMESIFLEKKLITNNINVKNYDFYCKDNIFIIGYDDFKRLPKFIKMPYKKVDSKIVNKYDYSNWIKRFGN